MHGRPPNWRIDLMSEPTSNTPMTGTPLGEISQAPPAFEMFLDRHQVKLIALAVVLALFAIGYVIYKGVKQSGEETAGNLLVSAEGMSDLQAIVKNHEGTAASYSAKILLAEQQWQDGQQDDSIATLRAFVEGELEHPARPAAQASLASKLRSQGKVDEAKKIFTELTENAEAGYLAPFAWVSLGDIANAANKPEEAEKAYATVEKDFPESPFKQVSMQRRLLLKADMPKEVAPVVTVPDVKLIEDKEETEEDSGSDSLIDALKQPNNGGLVPEIPVEETTPPSE